MHNFETRHGATSVSTVAGALVGSAVDGSHFEARLPFGRAYDGAATTQDLLAAADPPQVWGLLLVRKGGFAVAALSADTVTDSKVGQRHVQGRSKAGGWSQQRFARRRDNQARVAYEAAAGHAQRVIGSGPLVTGGDRDAIEAVLELTGWSQRVVAHLAGVREPRRSVLEEAVRDACSVRMTVTNA